MLVDIQNTVGDFFLSSEQLEKVCEIAFSHDIGHLSPENKKLVRSLKFELKLSREYCEEYGVSKAVYLPFEGMTEKESNRFRSHPWLIAAEKACPNEQHVLKEIEGDYYLINRSSTGIEHVITPNPAEFILGHFQ